METCPNPHHTGMKINYHRFIKLLFIPFAILNFSSAGAQVRINCCSINQTIPIFKSDTNFSLSRLYSPLITKKVLKPIEQSDAPLEIRLVQPGDDMETEVWTLVCSGHKMRILDYKMAVSITGQLPISYFSRFQLKNIGREHPADRLINWLKVDDLTGRHKGDNWNDLFGRLIDDHLFEMASGQAFINQVRALTNPNNYPEAAEHSHLIIQIKIGNKFRNLRYDGGYGAKYTNIDIIKQQFDFMTLLLKICQQ